MHHVQICEKFGIAFYQNDDRHGHLHDQNNLHARYNHDS